MGKKTRLIQKNDTSIRAINIVLTSKIIQTIPVRSYPDTDNTIYEMPLYEMIVNGSNTKGFRLSESFTTLRFGIHTDFNLEIHEQLISIPENKTYTLSWLPDLMDGVWQIHEDWLLIPGSHNPEVDIWGATGCIEVCGPNAWNQFIQCIQQLSGTIDLEAISDARQLTLTVNEVDPPTLKKYG